MACTSPVTLWGYVGSVYSGSSASQWLWGSCAVDACSSCIDGCRPKVTCWIIDSKHFLTLPEYCGYVQQCSGTHFASYYFTLQRMTTPLRLPIVYWACRMHLLSNVAQTAKWVLVSIVYFTHSASAPVCVDDSVRSTVVLVQQSVYFLFPACYSLHATDQIVKIWGYLDQYWRRKTCLR